MTAAGTGGGFESSEETRYVKVFNSDIDQFTITFCDYRGVPLKYIPRSAPFKTNQTTIPHDETDRLGEVIATWLLEGIDAEGNCVEGDDEFY